MTKRCTDETCRRAGQRLPTVEFWRNRTTRDGWDLYCRECRSRRNKASREYIKTHRKVKRKPMVIAPTIKDPLTRVYGALAQGCRTRETIQKKTHLTYDQIGDVLALLVFDFKAVRIQNREFLLVDSEKKAA